MKDVKQMISVRILESDRLTAQALANRLFVRESDIYRFAINCLFSRFNSILDISCMGSDLLLPFIEIRHELIHTFGLKKYQLERILNSGQCPPEKYVAMSDIELLLMPSHILKQNLMRLYNTPKDKLNLEEWLKEYLTNKYGSGLF